MHRNKDGKGWHWPRWGKAYYPKTGKRALKMCGICGRTKP